MNGAKIRSSAARALIYIAAGITCASLAGIVIYIFVKGVPYLSADMFRIKYTSENCSMFPAIINTLIITALSLLMALPLGIFSAVYLCEYAKKDSKAVAVIRMMTETLAGIPSIIFGLFGYLMFVIYLKWGYSILAGACTLAVMILPLIMRTSEEAIKAVPDIYREGSFGLGAGKLRTVFRVVLPSAVPGILSGVILATGRIAGETAALIFTAGTVAQIPHNVMGSGRTLSIHMYSLWVEGLHTEQSYATAVILLASVMLLNMLSGRIASLISKRSGENG
jgi:phosphate transport system permease protein